MSATIAPQADPPAPLRASGAPRFRDLRDDLGDLSELRASFEAHGWVRQLPAIADADGTIISGHRRMRVARELGIEPRIVRIDFGEGDSAEARRLKVAIASNIAQKPFTREERQKIARTLYATGSWSLQAIADALHVSDSTVSRDVAELPRQRQRRGRLRPDERARIVDLAAEGRGKREIMAEVGCSEGTVWNVLRESRSAHVCRCPVCGDEHRADRAAT
jgi:ParB-like chromosome segregation protein Spo0J